MHIKLYSYYFKNTFLILFLYAALTVTAFADKTPVTCKHNPHKMLIALGSGALLTGGGSIGAGFLILNRMNEVRTQYESAYDTETATLLGNRLESEATAVNTFFTVGEGCIGAGIIGLSAGVIRYFMRRNTGNEKTIKPVVSISSSREGTRIFIKTDF